MKVRRPRQNIFGSNVTSEHALASANCIFHREALCFCLRFAALAAIVSMYTSII